LLATAGFHTASSPHSAPFHFFLAANHFLIASVMAGITLFLIVALEEMVTEIRWWKGGFEMLVIESISALVAYSSDSSLERLRRVCEKFYTSPSVGKAMLASQWEYSIIFGESQ